MEVERDPVLIREDVASPMTSAASGTTAKSKSSTPRASGKVTPRASALACGRPGSSRKATARTTANTTSSRAMSQGSPIPRPAPLSPHVASGRNQTHESRGRAIASGTTASAK